MGVSTGRVQAVAPALLIFLDLSVVTQVCSFCANSLSCTLKIYALSCIDVIFNKKRCSLFFF